MFSAAGDLCDWDVVRAEARQVVIRLVFRDFETEAELAVAVTAPAEDLCEFLGCLALFFSDRFC